MKKNMLPVIGMVLGIVLVLGSIMASGDLVSFIDLPSLVITIFGSLSALLIIFPIDTFKNLPKVLMVLTKAPSGNTSETISLFVSLSQKSRRDGLLSLEGDIEEINDDLIRLGLRMAIDGMEPELVRDTLELKLAATEKRHRSAQLLFSKWGELAPAFGMLGTLIGLIIMLSGLDDPAGIGSGMATALITTFYGSFFANLIFLPISYNLSSATDEEMFLGDMKIEGVLEVQAGSNPRIIEEKLVNYLSPEEQIDFKSNGGNRVKEERKNE